MSIWVVLGRPFRDVSHNHCSLLLSSQVVVVLIVVLVPVVRVMGTRRGIRRKGIERSSQKVNPPLVNNEPYIKHKRASQMQDGKGWECVGDGDAYTIIKDYRFSQFS